MLVLGYYYNDSLEPVLETDARDISLRKGTDVRLAFGLETYCTGFYKDGRQRSCPKQTKGRKQCLSCAKLDERLVCLKCDGSTCLQFNNALKEGCLGREYVVYVASFGGLVKAGVSRKERVLKRWVEQGADFGSAVFEGVNGREARVIESELFAKGFLERMTLAQKLEAQQQPADPEAIKKAVESMEFETVAKAHVQNAVAPKMEDLQEFYVSLDGTKPTNSLQGRIIGAKGPLLALEQNGLRIFVLPSVVGKKILERTLADY